MNQGHKNRVRRRMRIAGLMSGTSADGVDAAIVDFDGRRVRVLALATFAYPRRLREELLNLFRPETGRVDAVCRLNFAVGEVFAQAVIRLAQRNGIDLRTIDLVGSHGQTIYHIPRGRTHGSRAVRSTLQIGEPSVIAERTGIWTVADFRPRDIAAGGEGAPLVPYADFLLFADRRRSRAVQNIGGIANVTYLAAGGGMEDVLAFDTGPGNLIIDHLVSRITGGRRTFDAGGRLAAEGTVDKRLLAELMRHPYLTRRPPKSTGREMFGAAFADALYLRARKRKIDPVNLVATATAFTARSIAESYRRFLPGPVDEVILAGGGVWNTTLINQLRDALGGPPVRLMSEFGIDPDAKEAISFAILAYATVHGLANNVPGATGAKKPVVLGKIVPGR